MNLSAFCDDFRALEFPVRAERARPPRERVRAVQSNLESALRGGAFLADCIEQELRLIDRPAIRRGLAPFLVVPDLGIRFALGYWGPGQDAGAHEHTDWTVTAVCHNALEIEVYDRKAAHAEKRLVQTNLHPAPLGKAGHIYDPCIHNPRNPTDAWSVSIHVIGAHDGEPVDGCEPFAGLGPARTRFSMLDAAHPFERCAIAKQRQRSLRALVEVLERCEDPRAPALLEAVFQRGNTMTRQLVIDALARRDPARAPRLRRALEATRISTGTCLVLPSPAIEREVRVLDGRAELVVSTPWGEEILVRVDDWATDALRALAREDSVLVRDIPGELDDAERVALAESLDEWALFEIHNAAAPLARAV